MFCVRTFKRHADNTAPPNLIEYLFSKNIVTQFIRLDLADAWSSNYPELNEPLNLLKAHCPRLVQSFLSAYEREDNMKQTSSDFQQMEKDPAHCAVIVDRKSFCFTDNTRNGFTFRQ
jgi:hypothetical protein